MKEQFQMYLPMLGRAYTIEGPMAATTFVEWFKDEETTVTAGDKAINI